MSILIVAEAGLNHLGNLDVAKELADHAKQSLADIVKFQTFIPEKVFRADDPALKMIAPLALSRADFIALAKHCENIDIEFMTTPGDLDSLRFAVEELGVKRIKIGSDDLTNKALVESAYKANLPLILSTGMATMDEIREATRILHPITLLHCVSNYPCLLEDANLAAITTMKRELPHYIGYSDHTAQVIACVAAAALGAVMIEAHFMLSTGTPPIDFQVSFPTRRFEIMVRQVRAIEKALGHGRKEPGRLEAHNIPLLRKGADGLRGIK